MAILTKGGSEKRTRYLKTGNLPSYWTFKFCHTIANTITFIASLKG